MAHLTTADLEAGLPHVRQAPADQGTVQLIVRRPAVDEREILEEAQLTLDEGVAGDTWKDRPSRRTPDGTAHPDMQLNIIGARLAHLISGGDEARAALAGDQLHVDLDLSETNLPPGTRLRIGDAVIEVTEQPHTGCKKFAARFGTEALKFVNAPEHQHLHLRGINAKVAEPGTIRRGDTIVVERPQAR